MSKSSHAAICAAEPPTQIHGPAHEYIRLMRSFLTDTQKAFVRDQIEALHRDNRASLLAYADLLRSCLSVSQRREVVVYLTSLYVERGWLPEAAL